MNHFQQTGDACCTAESLAGTQSPEGVDAVLQAHQTGEWAAYVRAVLAGLAQLCCCNPPAACRPGQGVAGAGQRMSWTIHVFVLHPHVRKCSGLAPLHSMLWQADLHWHVQVHPPDISFRDFEKVMLRARPTVSKDDLGIFEKYKNEFGVSTVQSAAALLGRLTCCDSRCIASVQKRLRCTAGSWACLHAHCHVGTASACCEAFWAALTGEDG